MALMIPTTRSTMPNQDAPTNVNSAEQFGSKVAAATNMPNVQNGQGGFVTQYQSAPTQIERERAPNTVVEYPNYAGMIGQVANAVDQVISDIDKKEEALRRANETVDFNKAKLDYHNAALEAQHNAKLMVQSGDLKDEVDAAGYYNDRITQLRDEHFPKGRFSTLEIETQSKMAADEVVGKYNQNFKEQVVIPAQTNRFIQTLSDTDNARNAQGLNEGRTTPIEKTQGTLVSGINAINAQYSSPEMLAVLTPKEVQSRKQAATLNYMQNFFVGMSEKGIDYNNEKQDKLVTMEQKIKNMRGIQSLIIGDSGIGAALGSNLDNMAKSIDSNILQMQSVITSERERRQRAAEAAGERNERNAVAAVKADVAMRGTDSPYLAKIDMLPPTQKLAVMEGYETFNKRQNTTVGEAQTFNKKYAGKQDSLVNPSPDDVKKADAYFELSGQQYNKMDDKQKMQWAGENFFKAGVVPTQIRDEVKHNLNSSDPKKVIEALDRMGVINDANPKALASAFSESEKALFIDSRTGKDPGKIITERDKTAELRKNKKPDEFEKEYNQGAYRAAGKLVKNEADFKEKIASELASQAKGQIFKGTFEFGDVAVADDVKEYLSDKVKTYVAHGVPFTKAVEAASKDASLSAGKSGVTGNKKSVVLFSPEVMTGKETATVVKEMKPVIDGIRIDPKFKNRPDEDFFLQPTPRTSRKNPIFEVWVKDKDGHAARAVNDQFQPYHYMAKRKDNK